MKKSSKPIFGSFNRLNAATRQSKSRYDSLVARVSQAFKPRFGHLFGGKNYVLLATSGALLSLSSLVLLGITLVTNPRTSQETTTKTVRINPIQQLPYDNQDFKVTSEQGQPKAPSKKKHTPASKLDSDENKIETPTSNSKTNDKTSRRSPKPTKQSDSPIPTEPNAPSKPENSVQKLLDQLNCALNQLFELSCAG